MAFICYLIACSTFLLKVISLEGRIKLDYILLIIYNIPLTLIFTNILTYKPLYLLLTLLVLNIRSFNLFFNNLKRVSAQRIKRILGSFKKVT